MQASWNEGLRDGKCLSMTLTLESWFIQHRLPAPGTIRHIEVTGGCGKAGNQVMEMWQSIFTLISRTCLATGSQHRCSPLQLHFDLLNNSKLHKNAHNFHPSSILRHQMCTIIMTPCFNGFLLVYIKLQQHTIIFSLKNLDSSLFSSGFESVRWIAMSTKDEIELASTL